MKSSIFCTILLILLTSLLTLCCQGRHQANVRSIEQTMELAQTDADSALQLLQGMDRTTFSDEETALFSLAYAMAQDKSGLDVHSDSMIRVPYNYFHTRPTHRHYGKCMYYMGKYYMLLDSIDESMVCFKEAIHASELQNDTANLCMAMEKYAMVATLRYPKSSLYYASKAVELYEKYSRATIPNLVLYMLNQAECYSFCGNQQKAIEIAQKTLKTIQKNGNQAVLASAYQDLSQLYCETGRVGEALALAKLSCNISPNPDRSKLLNLSECYLQNGQYENCQQILDSLTGKSDQANFDLFHRRLTIATLQGRIDMVMPLTDSVISYLEKMYVESAKEKEKYHASSLKQVQQLAYMQGQSSEYKTLFIWQILVSLLVLAFAYLIYIIRTKKIPLQLVQIKANSDRECEVKLKGKDIALQIRENEIMQQKESNELLKNYIVSKTKVIEKVRVLDSNGTKRIALDETDWEEMEHYLNAVHNGVVQRLRKKFPDFKEKDIQLLMLLKVGLSAKNMANIYCIQEKSIQQKLYVYKKKMGINGKDLSLREYLEAL